MGRLLDLYIELHRKTQSISRLISKHFEKVLDYGVIDIVNILNYDALAFKCHSMVCVKNAVESLVFEQPVSIIDFKIPECGYSF